MCKRSEATGQTTAPQSEETNRQRQRIPASEQECMSRNLGRKPELSLMNCWRSLWMSLTVKNPRGTQSLSFSSRSLPRFSQRILGEVFPHASGREWERNHSKYARAFCSSLQGLPSGGTSKPEPTCWDFIRAYLT